MAAPDGLQGEPVQQTRRFFSTTNIPQNFLNLPVLYHVASVLLVLLVLHPPVDQPPDHGLRLTWKNRDEIYSFLVVWHLKNPPKRENSLKTLTVQTNESTYHTETFASIVNMVVHSWETLTFPRIGKYCNTLETGNDLWHSTRSFSQIFQYSFNLFFFSSDQLLLSLSLSVKKEASGRVLHFEINRGSFDRHNISLDRWIYQLQAQERNHTCSLSHAIDRVPHARIEPEFKLAYSHRMINKGSGRRFLDLFNRVGIELRHAYLYPQYIYIYTAKVAFIGNKWRIYRVAYSIRMLPWIDSTWRIISRIYISPMRNNTACGCGIFVGKKVGQVEVIKLGGARGWCYIIRGRGGNGREITKTATRFPLSFFLF